MIRTLIVFLIMVAILGLIIGAFLLSGLLFMVIYNIIAHWAGWQTMNYMVALAAVVLISMIGSAFKSNQ